MRPAVYMPTLVEVTAVCAAGLLRAQAIHPRPRGHTVPTSATHITVVQRVAASDPAYAALLGNPDPLLMEDDPEAIKMRFAQLGAVGPDVFYALLDYNGDLQDLENFLMKVAGTFECIAELSEEISRYVDGVLSTITAGVADSLQQTFDLVSGTIVEGLQALIVSSGLNLWPTFEPARQRDLARSTWFWADYLHYIRSGRFVHNLLDLAKAKKDDNLMAYAYGYLTHYVTDVVGHPYVNQVVGAPWRLYWQRHHLVENFIDAYVWDRWHVPSPAPPPPTTAEPPLDRLVQTPNAIGAGAPLTMSRLHDHITVGALTAGDPVDAAIEAVCKAIHDGLFDLGIAEAMPDAGTADASFDAWCELMVEALHATYDSEPAGKRPMNLASSSLGVTPRPDGFPTAEDVAAAYGAFRLVLKIGTEERISDPRPPNIVGDVSAAVTKIFTDVASDLAGIPPPPSIPSGGSFSLDALWQSIKDWAEWVGDVVEAIGKAALDFVKDTIAAAGTAVGDAIKYALYLVNKALFALYRSFRDVLMMQAYCAPFTDQVTASFGPLSLQTLWRSMGDPAGYPIEEVVAETVRFPSTYNPALFPAGPTELPAVPFAAPYAPRLGGASRTNLVPIPALPDDFLEAPLGKDDMFRTSGPQQPAPGPSFASTRKDFGGAIANSRRGLDLAAAGFPKDTSLPDYNLDGDRGYAWPTWDVDVPPTPTSFGGDPLHPTHNAGGVATVRAVPAPD
jgi:hypothetical protein